MPYFSIWIYDTISISIHVQELTDMTILHPGKIKKKRFDKLKALSSSSYNRLSDSANDNKSHFYDEEDEYEADDEEFEDLEDTESAFDIAIEIAGEIW